jgi:hypothetical protein
MRVWEGRGQRDTRGSQMTEIPFVSLGGGPRIRFTLLPPTRKDKPAK